MRKRGDRIKKGRGKGKWRGDNRREERGEIRKRKEEREENKRGEVLDALGGKERG